VGHRHCVIIILGVLALVGVYLLRAQHKREEERSQRKASRTMTLDRLGNALMDASAAVQGGDLEAGISELRSAKLSLQGLLAEAEQKGTRDALDVLRSDSTEVDRTLQEAEAQRDALAKTASRPVAQPGHAPQRWQDPSAGRAVARGARPAARRCAGAALGATPGPARSSVRAGSPGRAAGTDVAPGSVVTESLGPPAGPRSDPWGRSPPGVLFRLPSGAGCCPCPSH